MPGRDLRPLIESSESRALAEHRVPGLDGSYFQDLGPVPDTIVISGTKHGDEFLNGIRKIFNAGGPTTFVADINTGTVSASLRSGLRGRTYEMGPVGRRPGDGEGSTRSASVPPGWYARAR